MKKIINEAQLYNIVRKAVKESLDNMSLGNEDSQKKQLMGKYSTPLVQGANGEYEKFPLVVAGKPQIKAFYNEETPISRKPSFNGGDANEFSKWVNQNLEYPEIAKENGVQGRVTLQFKVGADGKVSDVMVLRSFDSSLDKEAIRVVSMSPKWVPALDINKRPISVTYTFPVIFQLR